MPVPSLVTDLSTTAASNSPAGSENVFPSLDDYLRAQSAFLASIRDNSGNGWVSPYLPLAGGTVTGATTFSSTVALNGALSGTGLTTYLASPPAIGGTAAAAVSSTNLSYTGTLTGGTGVVALGTNQFYKDASGNVGIGTIAPGSFEGTVKTVIGGGAGSPILTLYGGNATYSGLYFADGVTGNEKYRGFFEYDHSTDALRIGTTGSTKATLDSSGNLGLGGVTPNGSYKFEVNGGGLLTGLNVSTGGAFNTANTATFDTNGAGAARFYSRGANASTVGSFQWRSQSSNGSVDTQAMTLDASGRLGVGSTPLGTARITAYGPSGDVQIRADDGNVTAYVAYTSGTGASAVNFYGTATNHAQAFLTNNAERARITSGGNLLVGKDTEFAQAFRLVAEANSSTTAVPGCFSDPRTDSASAITVAFYRNATKVGSIDTTNAATSYVTSSDRRLKQNIAPADAAGALIDGIEIVKHDWKVGGHIRYGVIAQDLHAVVPEAVSVGDGGDEIEKAWGVDYSKMVPMLVKEIQSLRARVAALEA